MLFDDVGFSDFGCYGSPITTPTIDAIAQRGLRYTGFHTTAMCSTTRAALLTGRNHHSVGVGCLANFDSGYPGYRGKIAKEAGTLAEMLRPHGYRNYMLGKWHVTPLTESGATGPFDGWPLGRGFDRFYGFLDAETDQYAPELVRDNTPVDPPGTFATGYHLTADLVDQAIRYLADHVADDAEVPWLTWVALGACHAPHQAPADLIAKYDALFANGWDDERDQRIARQKKTGIVPQDTRLPPRNDLVRPWAELPDARKAALHAAAGGLCRDARACRPASRAADRRSSSSRASSTTRWSSSCPTTAPARRADRSAWSMRWVPTTCAASRSRRRSRGSTISAGPTPIPTSRSAGRWRPTRRCAATSRTPMAAASAIRW